MFRGVVYQYHTNLFPWRIVMSFRFQLSHNSTIFKPALHVLVVNSVNYAWNKGKPPLRKGQSAAFEPFINLSPQIVAARVAQIIPYWTDTRFGLHRQTLMMTLWKKGSWMQRKIWPPKTKTCVQPKGRVWGRNVKATRGRRLRGSGRWRHPEAQNGVQDRYCLFSISPST